MLVLFFSLKNKMKTVVGNLDGGMCLSSVCHKVLHSLALNLVTVKMCKLPFRKCSVCCGLNNDVISLCCYVLMIMFFNLMGSRVYSLLFSLSSGSICRNCVIVNGRACTCQCIIYIILISLFSINFHRSS